MFFPFFLKRQKKLISEELFLQLQHPSVIVFAFVGISFFFLVFCNPGNCWEPVVQVIQKLFFSGEEILSTVNKQNLLSALFNYVLHYQKQTCSTSL